MVDEIKSKWELLLDTLNKEGLPTVIALGLIIFILWWMTGDFRGLRTDVQALAIQEAAHSTAVDNFNDSVTATREGQDKMLSIMRQMCINTAKTDQQRTECVK